MLVEVRPRIADVRSPQRWVGGADEGVSLGEQGAPGRLGVCRLTGGGDLRQAQPSLHRHRGDVASEVEEITDVALWQRQQQFAADGLWHPCTPVAARKPRAATGDSFPTRPRK